MIAGSARSTAPGPVNPTWGSGPLTGLAGLHTVRRALREALPDQVIGDNLGADLEHFNTSLDELPRTEAAEVLEHDTVRAVTVASAPEVRFAAFLDGTQQSHVVHDFGGCPLVWGTVAAVIRQRRARTLVTWDSPRVASRLYAPTRLLDSAITDQLRTLKPEFQLFDSVGKHELEEHPHPYQLTRLAIRAVQRDREELERELADAWCRREQQMLYLDGSLPRGSQMATSPWRVGVIKSHHTLYVQGDALQVVLKLREAERSSVLRHRPGGGYTRVATWYLRLRDSRGRDPLWGLVRVEVALTEELDESTAALAQRADDVSAWILAERTPLALPDSRWDRLAYGIHDCEKFLRAITR